MKKIILITLTISLNLSLFYCFENDDFDIQENQGVEVLNETQTCCDRNGKLPQSPPDEDED
jgi:hypothetical protein